MSNLRQKLARAARHLAAGQDGHTLFEMLLVTAMLIGVLLLPIKAHDIFAADQQRIESANQTLVEQRNGLERMTRDIRQALYVCRVWPTCGAFSNSSTIDIQRCASVTATGCTSATWVRYDCGATVGSGASATRACVRSESAAPADLGQSARTVVKNLAATQPGIFTHTAVPEYVSVSLQVNSHGLKNAIALQDGVQLRNRS
jgi:hypothetical protein